MATGNMTLKRILSIGFTASIYLGCTLGVQAAEATKQDYFNCAVSPQAGQPKQVEANKAVVKRYLEALGTSRFDAVLKEVKGSGYTE